MKKILLASTILVGSAGVAAADIGFSGEAYMGIGSVDGGVTWTPTASASMDVAMSGETDGGLTFGADFTITAGAPAGTVGEATVWIGGDFGTVSLDQTGSLGYEHSFGDFGIDFGYEIGAGTWDIELSYGMGDYDAYMTFDSASTVGLGGSASFGDFSVSVDLTDVTGAMGWELGLDYASGAISAGLTLDDTNAWGLSAGYDLGGGASVDGSIDSLGVIALGISMDF